MAKNTIKKKEFSMDALKGKFSSKTKYKPNKFFDLGEDFQKACGVPGPAVGHLNMLLGHSNTGKTTALIGSAVWAQKNNILPVFIITEKKWDFMHAQISGLDCEEKSPGEWDGFFLFKDDFDYIEQITDYVNELLDAQQNGDIPYDMVFLWDSVGSIPCKMTYDGKGGVMHNARVFSDKVGMGLNSRIGASRKEDSEFTNSIIFVNQPWVELPDNPFGQPTIKPKGGNAIFLNCTLVFLFGNQKNAGVSRLSAVKNGRKVSFATRTKVSILKNHVNGIEYQDGKILATPHGFVDEDKKDDYKKDHSEYWAETFIKSGIEDDNGDFDIEETDTIDV